MQKENIHAQELSKVKDLADAREDELDGALFDLADATEENRLLKATIGDLAARIKEQDGTIRKLRAMATLAVFVIIVMIFIFI